MKLSAAAELAVRGILVLAKEYGNGPTTLDSVCARRQLPKQYLVKIFSSLARADLITPIRGKKGGYLPSRGPETISVHDVIEAVEGPIALNLRTRSRHGPSHSLQFGFDQSARSRYVWTPPPLIARVPSPKCRNGDGSSPSGTVLSPKL